MRLNNEIVVLDLEATSNQEKYGDRPLIQKNNFIIEIGAVLLNRDLEFIDTFQSFVRPEETITPFITKLTSITPEMCADQPLWKDVAPKFEAWITSHVSNIKRVRLAAWGTYFDIPMLRHAYAHYGRPFPFSGTCFDVKTLAMLWMALSGHRTDKLSVGSVAKTMGITKDGQYHRALTDAVVETTILHHVLYGLQGGFFVPSHTGHPNQYLKIERAY